MLTAHRYASTSLDLTHRIGAWAEDFTPTAAQLARIRASVQDFIGCVVAGTRRTELRPALWLAHGGGVPVWGLADSFDAAGAALVAGTAGSLLQLHDFYSPGASHPSAPVIAAAWSALHSEKRPRDVGFLRAAAAGYEIANRIAAACMPAQITIGSMPTATAGAIGAAVAAALLRGLDRDGIARAVGNAALLLPASPMAAMRSHGALVPMHAGLAARAGFEAASLAREAGAGARVLEGDADGPGLIRLLGGDVSRIQPESWRGETIDAVGWKFFPACLATHVALEAVLRMGTVDTSTLRRVIVRQPKGILDPIVRSGPAAGDLYDRLMSLRWVIARALEDNRYEYPAALASDERTHALAQRVELQCEEGPADASSPELRASIELHTSGSVRRFDYRRPAWGDPELPGPRGWTRTLDEINLRKKFEALVSNSFPRIDSLTALGID
jgi:2-methylcitrate dehydratase PrpD